MSDLQWHYEPAADLDQSLTERLRHFPRQPDLLVYGLRSIAALALRLWLRTYHRLSIVGRENLPASGSCILVANHASHLDALCLLSALPVSSLHRAFPVAARDYFFVSLPRVAVAAIFINAIPFARQTHMRQSLDLCRQLLANPGNMLILFPEGTRSTTGQLGDFRPGIGSLVAGSDLPVVPCALQGTFRAWPKGSLWPRPRRLRLVIGEPRTFAHLPPGRESIHLIARQLQDAVQELLCR